MTFDEWWLKDNDRIPTAAFEPGMSEYRQARKGWDAALARVAVLPDKVRALKDGKHLQDYVAMLIEEAIDADVQNGFTRDVFEAVRG